MREGTFLKSFRAGDGREVTLRAPRWSDLDDMLEFINSLVDEGADIMRDAKVTRGEEVDWLSGLLSAVEKDEKAYVAAEVDGRFVGSSEVRPREGRSRHVGVLGIALRSGYRDVGIGTELMREAENQARRLGLKMLTLEVFSTNRRAIHVYEKVGYKVVGCIPKAVFKEGRYADNMIMAKDI